MVIVEHNGNEYYSYVSCLIIIESSDAHVNVELVKSYIKCSTFYVQSGGVVSGLRRGHWHISGRRSTC